MNVVSQRTAAGQKVWEAAASLFYRHGIRAVGVAEICERSGVAKPVLYRNFSSKDLLVVEYLRDQGSISARVVEEARVTFPGLPVDQLRHVIDRTVSGIGAPGYRGCPLANAAIEFPDQDHPIHREVEALKSAFLKSLTSIASEIPVSAPSELAYSIMMLLEGASCSAQIFPASRLLSVASKAAEALIQSHASSKSRGKKSPEGKQ